MIEKNEILKLCDYYFSVLAKDYLALEKKVDECSKFIYLFKKVNRQKFADAFIQLKDMTQEAYDVIANENTKRDDYGELHSLAIHVKMTYSTFLSLLDNQIKLQMFLVNKANAKGGSLSEYNDLCKAVSNLRELVEKITPILQKEYSDELSKESR